MTKTAFLIALFLAAAITSFAADVSGKWTAQVPGRSGQMRDATITLKADGEKLTGSMTGGQGQENAIAEGKVTGDKVSFSVTVDRGGNTIKQSFTGTVAGDEIKFKREGGQGQPIEFTAKRAK